MMRLTLAFSGPCRLGLVALLGLSSSFSLPPPEAREATEGRSHMVVTGHAIASTEGEKILQMGGNAIDAAVTIQFVLAVVLPAAGNIGGGGFALIRTPQGSHEVLDFREKAPLKSRRDMYLDDNGNVVAGLSTLGHLAAGVPGSVAGMWAMHGRYGYLPWDVLVEPAVRIARSGFLLTERGARALSEKQDDFRKANLNEPPWVLREEGWKMGDAVVQPDLASTLGYIQSQGEDGFYKGIVAQQIVEEMRRGGGIMSLEDLEGYQAVWRAPLQASYRGYRIHTVPPPSSGGVALVQLLKSVEHFPVGRWGFGSAKTLHLTTEVERWVYADRAMNLGDPDAGFVDVEGLLDDGYIRERRKGFSRRKKRHSERISAYQPPRESMQTTHFSVLDSLGNGVSLTTTLNGFFGCKVMVQGAGFFLNNEMDDFSSKPGAPNMFGLTGGQANSIAPGKRMLSSMTPTMLESPEGTKLILGSPGGGTIITSVFQVIVNVVDHAMPLTRAIDSPKVHSQWLPDVLYAEPGALAGEVRLALQKKGHQIRERDPWGQVNAIMAFADGVVLGVEDLRGGDAKAVGR